MKQVQVEILCQVMTAQYGTLQQGAILRTDAAFAKHLVDDCGAAKYVTQAEVAPVQVPAKVSRARKPAAAAESTAVGPAASAVEQSDGNTEFGANQPEGSAGAAGESDGEAEQAAGAAGTD
ncbi:MAG: hypothetical protein ACXW2U_08870 [Telluria sp.]